MILSQDPLVKCSVVVISARVNRSAQCNCELPDVIGHNDGPLKPASTLQRNNDLVAYLKSLQEWKLRLPPWQGECGDQFEEKETLCHMYSTLLDL
jgi:hypothetical protein